MVNNTFVGNSASDPYNVLGYGGAVLAASHEYATASDAMLLNNILYGNTAKDSNSGNSVARRPFASLSLLFCGGFSQVSDQYNYHYLNVSPGDGCYCAVLGANDPSMFTNGYHLASPGPLYSPIDLGHDVGVTPYDVVPSDDLDGLPRPASEHTDMGAYELQGQ